MHLVALGVGGAAYRLAVHHDRERLGGVLVGLSHRDLTRGDLTRGDLASGDLIWGDLASGSVASGGVGEQPGADHRVHRVGVDAGDHSPDGGLRRGIAASAVEPGEHLGGHVGGPAGDRGERGHTRHNSGRAQHEYHRDRVNPTLITATIRHCREPLQQVRTHHGRIRQIRAADRSGYGRTEGSETGLGDGRMQQQRSSGGGESVRGRLHLPELHCLSGRDTPKITKL